LALILSQIYTLAILGNIIKRYLKIQDNFQIQSASARSYQTQQLKRLLRKAKGTAFGKEYKFDQILKGKQEVYQAYKKSVPYHDYASMYKKWWRFSHEGELDIAWPGKVRYFALSSGTSESASKHIPVTQEMIKSVKRTGFKQFVSLLNFDLPVSVFEKGVLMLGGTTALFERGDYYEGDMSGISAREMPRWLSFFFYKPGQSISKRPRWEDRINLIVRKAKSWDVSIVCGVPAWVQIVLEEVVRYHEVEHIHEIWPNLSLYIHGGVAFDPYKESFKKILGHPITYIETYMASEGSFGFQARPNERGISLVTNNQIFYEFVPFTSENFDEEGNIKQEADSYMIHEVVEKKDYAVVLSTCSGAWRYLIGDVVRFTSVPKSEIIIVGRTKQFLSLCGEHLSVDNMNSAIDLVQRKLGIEIKEFTVTGIPYEGLFAHKWYIGCDSEIDTVAVCRIIDECLQEINDDYKTERESALKEIFVDVVPNEMFIEYLDQLGKLGAMNKFPRVLKGDKLKHWEAFISSVST